MTERLLLEELDRRLEEIDAGSLPRRPIRIVVPSRSLRTHLLGRIVARRGRAAAGLHCTTLFALARSLVERHDGPVPLRDDLGALYARRFAADEEALRDALGHLRDGYRAVDGPVRDLLEAGFDPAHREALEEALREEGPANGAAPDEIERACALVRVAARSLAALGAAGVVATPGLLSRAAELVRTVADPEPAEGALLVHGFSDAIGVVIDLLQALLDRHGGTLYLDHPPDAAEPERPDASVVFTRRFGERIGDVARPQPRVAEAPAPEITMFQALGGEAEAREVAVRVRALLDEGASPERIGIVARRLEPHRSVLRTQLWRLAIPFSALGATGPMSAVGRRLRALLDLLERRESLPVERWLDARAGNRGPAASSELRLALAAAGAGRLGEVAGRPYRELARDGSYALPVRRGFATHEQEVFARRRKVPLATLETIAADAEVLCDRFAAWRRETRLSGHLEQLRDLAEGDLGWRAGGSAARALREVLDGLAGGVDGELEIGFDEVVDLLRRPLESLGRVRLGGEGGGVAVLDVTEARGRTFEHLFVIGLNRGVFPRVVGEDPLLPDGLRAVLSRHGFGVLQDLPQRLAGFDEERYLFSQLLAAGEHITLSWQEIDDDNRPLTPSPLIERLRWSAAGEPPRDWRTPATATPVYSPPRVTGSAPRPPHEIAVLAGIHGDRRRFAGVLGAALELAGALPDPDADSDMPPLRPPRGLGATRVRILDELDPLRGRTSGERARSRLGPYFGLVGAPAGERDPRRGDELFVTTLEGIAACPWQTFLERVLRLEPLPDPLEALPGVEPLYIGRLVHDVLEQIVSRSLPDPPADLERARARSPVAAPWPVAEELERLVARRAERLVREAGFAFPGFARLLGEAVAPYLEVARRLDWSRPDGPAVVGAELRGRTRVEDASGRPRTIAFAADRIDGGEGGDRDEGSERLTLTDYKSGRPLSSAKKEATRRRHLLRDVAAGDRLQAVAYALAAGEPGGRGRYLFLLPDPAIEDDQRVIEAAAADHELADAFGAAVRTALEAWDRGAFFPRLVEPRLDREPRLCASCRVSDACLRGDSAARGRLGDWMKAHGDATPEDPEQRAALGVWRLRPEGAGRERRRGGR